MTGVPPWQSRMPACQHSASLCRHSMSASPISSKTTLSNHLQSHPSTLEPKIADAPPFSGNRKDLLPFLTKCRLKFGGQPLRFGDEKSKVLYAGARLEGPAFGWFQP